MPAYSASPGVYAIVGMGAVVAGTTQGVFSAILIVYEMTNDYHIILPIMVAAGLASIVAESIDPESIYLKKLSRRGEDIARGHDMHRVEHVMVRDVMIREFPSVKQYDNLTQDRTSCPCEFALRKPAGDGRPGQAGRDHSTGRSPSRAGYRCRRAYDQRR